MSQDPPKIPMSEQDQEQEQEKARGVQELQESAANGDPESQYRLGLLYGNGEGVPLDHGQAEHWFTQAARQGHEGAVLNLAWLYATGTGVEADDKKARELYLLAAKHGSGKAQYVVATMYRAGQHGLEPDLAKALHYYQLAAENGVAAAQFALGKLLMEGKVVARDDVVALQWLTLAQANGSKRAEEYIPHLVARMSPEQLAQAREAMLRAGGD